MGSFHDLVMSSMQWGVYFVKGWASKLGQKMEFVSYDEWWGCNLCIEYLLGCSELCPISLMKDCYKWVGDKLSWGLSVKRSLSEFEDS